MHTRKKFYKEIRSKRPEYEMLIREIVRRIADGKVRKQVFKGSIDGELKNIKRERERGT